MEDRSVFQRCLAEVGRTLGQQPSWDNNKELVGKGLWEKTSNRGVWLV